jgi:hypothetical protein
MKLNFFCFALLASPYLQAGALTEDERAPTTPVQPTAAAKLVAKDPVNGAEISAILGGDASLAAPPRDDDSDGGRHRLLQTSSIQRLSPLAGETIGANHAFQALVADTQGVNLVVFRILFPDGVSTLDFDASLVSSGVYGLDLEGFSAGNWAWQVWVQDRIGNWAYSTFVSFSVSDSGGNGGGGGGGGGNGIGMYLKAALCSRNVPAISLETHALSYCEHPSQLRVCSPRATTMMVPRTTYALTWWGPLVDSSPGWEISVKLLQRG